MPWMRRWRVLRIILWLGCWGVAVGPWPMVRPIRTELIIDPATAARFDQFPQLQAASEFRVGVARTDLTPHGRVTLAGFIDQIWQPYDGVNSACFAQALTVANRSTSVTILAADLLLIDQRLARAVLRRTGLATEQVYFTATHTHSGPGGWGNHPLERLVAGTYEPAVFDMLAERLADVVTRSRTHLQPAEVAFVQTEVSEVQINRITPGSATNDALSAWIFRSMSPPAVDQPGPVLATLVSFGAHATIAHPVPPRLGGDYPGALAAALPRLVDAGIVMFAAGTVGDSSPVRPRAVNQQQSAEAYAAVLATRLASCFPAAQFHREIELTNIRVDVDLPPQQVQCFAPSLRFSPLLMWWVGRRASHLHLVRLGPAMLVGFPGDYAGHLAANLRSGLPVVATSFNGDYKGYLVSRATYMAQPDSYEARWMSFFGPGLGDFLTTIAQRGLDRLAPITRSQEAPISGGKPGKIDDRGGSL